MSRHRLVLAPLALALIPVLGACGSGPRSAISDDYSPGDGALGTKGDLRVVNALVVAPTDGRGNALVSMRISDTGQGGDTLKSVQVGNATATPVGDANVPSGGVISVGGSDADAQVTLPASVAHGGDAVRMTLLFARAGSLSIETVAVGPNGVYQTLTPAAAPTPTTTPVAPAPAATPASPPAAGTPGAPAPVATATP